jgi:hypothetical protein
MFVGTGGVIFREFGSLGEDAGVSSVVFRASQNYVAMFAEAAPVQDVLWDVYVRNPPYQVDLCSTQEEPAAGRKAESPHRICYSSPRVREGDGTS